MITVARDADLIQRPCGPALPRHRAAAASVVTSLKAFENVCYAFERLDGRCVFRGLLEQGQHHRLLICRRLLGLAIANLSA